MSDPTSSAQRPTNHRGDFAARGPSPSWTDIDPRKFLRIARRLLDAPLAVLIGGEGEGAPQIDAEPARDDAMLRVAESLLAACRDVQRAGALRLVQDMRPPAARAMPAAPGEIVAFIAVPVSRPDSQRYDVLCVADGRPRGWGGEEAGLLVDLATAVTAVHAARFHRDQAGRIRSSEADARARMQADLRERDEKLTLAERSAGIGIWDVDLASGTMRGTPQFFEIMGLPATSRPVPIEVLRALRHPDDRARVVDGFRQAISEGRESYEMEYRILRPDGRQRWIFGRGRVVRDAAGVAVRYSGIDIDITERKEAQEALALSSERLKLAQEAAGLGTWDWDIEADRLYWSANEWRVHGREPASETASFATWQSLVHPDDRARSARVLREAVAAQSGYTIEYRVQSPDRGLRWILARGTVIADATGRAVRLVGVSVDVTDQRRAAEALADLNSALEARVRERTAAVEAEAARRIEAEERLHQAQKMEAIGQLTGGVAHDFNNVLTVIIGGAETLQRRIARNELEPRRIAELAETILASGRRAASLTQHLLAFSRRQPLEPKPLNANELVARVAGLLRRTLGERIAVECRLAEDLGTVSVDANQLEMALLNLAVNARDAMPDGGTLTIVTRDLRVGTAASRPQETEPDDALPPGEYVELAVRDSGSGMTPEVRARAFEPFFTTKGLGRGTGLGLSQVYGFITQSMGHVAIDSAPGEGCCVRIVLPRIAAPPVAAAAPAAIDSGIASGKGECVLLVEDDAHIRVRSAETLRELGYAVLDAANATAALAILARTPNVDLLLTDIGLPGGMNGRALAEAALRERPALKILFMSGYAMEAVVHDGRLDPGVDLIAKPFGYAALAAKLRDVLDRRAIQRLAIVVDDEPLIRRHAAELLRELGFVAQEAGSVAEARDSLRREDPPMLAVIDVDLPDGRGDALARELRRNHPGLAILLATGDADPQPAETMRGDRFVRVVGKPFDKAQLQAAIGELAAPGNALGAQD